MVEIKKGAVTRFVSSGAFKNYYQKSGWVLANAPPPENQQPPADDTVDTPPPDDTPPGDSDEDAEANAPPPENQQPTVALNGEELLEKPVAEMTADEVRRAADFIGFDYKTEGLNATQIRRRLPELIAAR